MFLIAGTKASVQVVGRGTFWCPNEESDQSYRHVELKRQATAFFIPVANVGDLGEYVECDSCGATYKPEVLTLKRPEEFKTALAVAVIELSIEVILADGLVTPEERLTALELANQYLDPPGLTLDDLQEMIAALETRSASKRSRITRARLGELSANLNVAGRETLIRVAYLLAASDGVVVDTELDVIRSAAKHLGLDWTQARSLFADLSGN